MEQVGIYETTYFGEDVLRNCLVEHGYKLTQVYNIPWDSMDRTGTSNIVCNWYAYKKNVKIPARRCECNNDNEGMQIVVTPNMYKYYSEVDLSHLAADVCGEYDGMWWKIQVYEITVEEFIEKFDKIEHSLIAAWNALGDAKK